MGNAWIVVVWAAGLLKIGSTIVGLHLQKKGDLFATQLGKWAYGISKVTPTVLGYGMYRISVLGSNDDGAVFFGWVTVLAALLTILVVAKRFLFPTA